VSCGGTVSLGYVSVGTRYRGNDQTVKAGAYFPITGKKNCVFAKSLQIILTITEPWIVNMFFTDARRNILILRN
jgi:hypothetical protein